MRQDMIGKELLTDNNIYIYIWIYMFIYIYIVEK